MGYGYMPMPGHRQKYHRRPTHDACNHLATLGPWRGPAPRRHTCGNHGLPRVAIAALAALAGVWAWLAGGNWPGTALVDPELGAASGRKACGDCACGALLRRMTDLQAQLAWARLASAAWRATPRRGTRGTSSRPARTRLAQRRVQRGIGHGKVSSASKGNPSSSASIGSSARSGTGVRRIWQRWKPLGAEWAGHSDDSSFSFPLDAVRRGRSKGLTATPSSPQHQGPESFFF